MALVDRLRIRWRHFLGADLADDLESRQRALVAELDFALALQHLQRSLGTYDKRLTSDRPRDMTLDGLAKSLDNEDRLVREALGDDR